MIKKEKKKSDRAISKCPNCGDVNNLILCVCGKMRKSNKEKTVSNDI